MDVVKSRHAGACYGVQRALQLAQEAAADGGRATTLGPLIHNPQVVADLERKGVRAANAPSEISEGTVLIRSHGVTPQVKAEVRALGLPVVDATCPHVEHAQQAAADLAARIGTVVVVGAAGHPEVEGLRAYAEQAGARVVVAESPEDLPGEMPACVGVVVQTTQTHRALDAVCAALDERGICAEVKNTICFATAHRQEAAEQLAASVDAMVVVGGRNSANTTHLYEICAKSCPRTFHIETAEELDPAWFAGCSCVGVTAGASTPEAYIDTVIDWLRAR